MMSMQQIHGARNAWAEMTPHMLADQNCERQTESTTGFFTSLIPLDILSLQNGYVTNYKEHATKQSTLRDESYWSSLKVSPESIVQNAGSAPLTGAHDFSRASTSCTILLGSLIIPC